MNRSKFIYAIVAMMIVIFATSSAMAIVLNTRSEEMLAKSPCDKAGSLTFKFQENDYNIIKREVNAGNTVIIRVTLNGTDMIAGSQLPTLCQPIIEYNAAGNPVTRIAPVSDGAVQLDYTGTAGDGYTTGEASAIHTVGGAADITAFVYGNSGSRFFTIYITNIVTIIGTPWGDEENWPWIKVGLYKELVSVGGQIPTTICANVTDFSDFNKLTVSPEMIPNDLTYTSADDRIGHFLSATVSESPCKGKTVGNIQLGQAQAQALGTCTSFDNEAETGAGNAGYCAGTHLNNKLILASSDTFKGGNANPYQTNFRILVNDKYGDRGVYFSNQQVAASGYNDITTACAGLGTTAIAGAYTYLKADNTVAVPLAPVANQCSIVDANRAVSMTTPAVGLNIDGMKYLYIDLPAFNYDLTTVENIIATEGSATVKIEYTVFEAPCGTLVNGTHEIGTFGCEVVRTCLYFPYVFRGQGMWECGIALSNINPQVLTTQNIDDMEVTFTLHATDGKTYTYVKNDFTTPSWAAMLDDNSQFKFTTVPPNGVGWLEVSANFRVDGYQFVTDGTFGGTTQPRVLVRCNNYDGWK